ncbi:hypothetical protein ACI2OX_16780 [Bacillus sp. N9]
MTAGKLGEKYVIDDDWYEREAEIYDFMEVEPGHFVACRYK